MPKARISRSTVDKLESVPGKQVAYFDTKLTGFGVKVNSTCKTYFVQCRVKGRKNAKGNPLEIYESLGRTDVVDFDKAFSKAKKILDDAADGIAPDDIRLQNANLEAEKKIRAAQDAKKDVTLMEVFKDYIVIRKKIKRSTIDSYLEDIERYIPDWKDTPLRSIDGNMILVRHAEIGKRSKARADGVMRVLRALFNHAMHTHEDVIYKNPVLKLSAMGAWYKVPRRESYIRPADLRKWLPEVLKLNYDTTQDFILMMLFQGSRVAETGALKWKDINLTERTAVFRDTKPGVVLEVPLSRFIAERMEARKRYYYSGPESYVFPSFGETGHMTDARSALGVVEEKTGVKATHHDLRRSFITYCEELEISIFSRKRLANHAIPLDVTEGYTFFNMAKLREIIEKVASFILSSAGIPYDQPESPPLSEEQAAKVADTEFWSLLTESQKEAFIRMLAPDKETAPNVVSIEAAKVRRRMKAPS